MFTISLLGSHVYYTYLYQPPQPISPVRIIRISDFANKNVNMSPDEVAIQLRQAIDQQVTKGTVVIDDSQVLGAPEYLYVQ